ncbi:MAG: class I SAM-dependent methyltransferase, partial [Sphaerochaetaceae bacterium]|nr:class I SAM-dependent methyltransferase [Sphaerochaetaceae bacterium]
VTCYRLYDADMPEYSAAIDVYESKWISLQEYAAPSSIDPEDAKRRLEELVLATERTTGIDYDNIYVKRREIQKGANQYTKKSNSSHFYIVNENGHKFLVNFADYLDTGIFLDHRPVRKLIQTMSKDKRFLNLFCYTGTATVHAAAGGALSTVSVDANANYLEWANKNMQINGLNTMNHFFYKDDCLSFLRENRDVFDLIFCDPPTFSNSKGRDTFDVQRDHGYLIRSCMKHLAHDGVLIFSTNFTRFKLFGELYEDFIIEDITESTIGDDFKRNSKIHRCYMIRHKIQHALQIEPVKRLVKKVKPKA